MSDDKVVTFLMPDGTEVSNDLGWQMEQQKTPIEAALEVTPNTGKAGIPDEEMEATIGVGMAPPQSGQPGVGENATFEDPDKAFSSTPAMLAQLQDRKEASEAGNTPTSPALEADEPEDVNQKVLEVREARQKALEKEAEALAKLGQEGEEPGDTTKPYSEWSAKQLQAELKVRNARREAEGQEPIDTKGVKRKSELAELLEADSNRSQA